MGQINTRTWQRHLPHFQSDLRTYSITFTTRNRFELPPDARSIVLDHIVFDHQRRYFLHTGIVMPDHVHLAATPRSNERGESIALSTILQGIKGASSRSVNRYLGRHGRLWLHESYDREIRSDEDLREICEYICNNPVRAGIVERADDYAWLWREWIEGRATRDGRLRGGPT